MKEFLKQQLKQGETVTFDNEAFNEAIQSDDFRSMECSLRNEKNNTWANGFKIIFNGQFHSFKTFNAFFKKVEQLVRDFNLEIKTKIQ